MSSVRSTVRFAAGAAGAAGVDGIGGAAGCVTSVRPASLGRLEVGLAAMVAAGVLAAAALHPLWHGSVQVQCPLLVIFGIPCVTCGGTRALVALMTGNAAVALAWNPLVALGGVGAMAGLPLAGLMLAGVVRRPRIPTGLPVAARRVIVAVFALNWAYLLIWFRG